MGEQVKDQGNESAFNDSGIIFDNLTILREISKIVDLVSNEDFMGIFPKSKLKRVKWIRMFIRLKQGIYDSIIQEMNLMWNFEDMPAKLQSLEDQKEKFAEINPEKTVWRPQLNDVPGQLKASDFANLKNQKEYLQSLAKEYESRANRQEKLIIGKRRYLKAMQMNIQKYQKKNEVMKTKLNDILANHVAGSRQAVGHAVQNVD